MCSGGFIYEGVRSKRAFFAIQLKLGSKGPFNLKINFIAS